MNQNYHNYYFNYWHYKTSKFNVTWIKQNCRLTKISLLLLNSINIADTLLNLSNLYKLGIF